MRPGSDIHNHINIIHQAFKKFTSLHFLTSHGDSNWLKQHICADACSLSHACGMLVNLPPTQSNAAVRVRFQTRGWTAQDHLVYTHRSIWSMCICVSVFIHCRWVLMHMCISIRVYMLNVLRWNMKGYCQYIHYQAIETYSVCAKPKERNLKILFCSIEWEGMMVSAWALSYPCQWWVWAPGEGCLVGAGCSWTHGPCGACVGTCASSAACSWSARRCASCGVPTCGRSSRSGGRGTGARLTRGENMSSV